MYPEEAPTQFKTDVFPNQKPATSFRQTIWACVRLARLHTMMGWAMFPAPAIYTAVVWFAVHREAFSDAGIDSLAVLRHCGNLLLRLTVVIMSYRCAGLAWDDLIDRSFDGKVKRTKSRPLPSGDITVDIACLYIATQSAVTWGLIDTLLPGQLHQATFLAMAVFVPYPYLKRITSTTQFFGAALLAMGVLQGWATCSSSSIALEAGIGLGQGWSAFINHMMRDADLVGPLFMMEFLFELAHEVVYGNQDTEDDSKLGLYSLARFLGPSRSYPVVTLAVAGFVSLLYTICHRAELYGANAIVLIAGSILAWETFQLDMSKPESCGRWAKRGVQLKMFLCVAFPASLAATLLW